MKKVFTIGRTVYLRANPDARGTVVGIVERPHGVITYLVGWGEVGEEHEHWECELTETRGFDGIEETSGG